METSNLKGKEKTKRFRKRTKSFTEALKEKYCVEDESTFRFINIVSPKRKNSTAELAHLKTVVLNYMDVTKADIPRQGLMSLCPNVVDLDLANNSLEQWSELVTILSHLPLLKYVNVSQNKLRLNSNDELPDAKLCVENLALNGTGVTIEEILRLSKIMPELKELHLCGNGYDNLPCMEEAVKQGVFSTLECLRLNNNNIQEWLEVWKLHCLPGLKFLILSGNPLSNIFYKNKTECKTSEDQSRLVSEAPSPADDLNIEGETCISSEECDSATNSSRSCSYDGNNSSLQESSFEAELSMLLNDNELDLEDIIVEEDEEDGFDDIDDIDGRRPVSRFERHPESECSNFSEDGDDPVFCHGRFSVEERKGSEDFLHFMQPSDSPSDSLNNSEMLCSSPTDINFNNSQNNEKRLFDQPCPELQGWIGALQDEDPEENLEENPVTEQGDDTDEWPSIVAEAFLYNVINSIDFDSPNSALLGENASEPSAGNGQPVSDVSSPSDQLDTLTPQSPTEEMLSDQAEISGGSTADMSPDVLDANQNALTAKFLGVQEQGSHSHVTKKEGDCSGTFLGAYLNKNTSSDALQAQVSGLSQQLSHTSSCVPAATKERAGPKAQRQLFQVQSLRDMCLSCEGRKVAEKSALTCSNCDVEGKEHSISGQTLFPVKNTDSNKESPNRESLSESGPGCENVDRQESKELCASATVEALKGERDSVTENSQAQLQNAMEDHTHINPVVQSGNSEEKSSTPVDSTMGGDLNLHPFEKLQMLCISNASLNHWRQLEALSLFPKLTNVRLQNNPLYSDIKEEDRRKLYIASLPKVNVLNGSEISPMEREKAERHFLRHFMDKEEKPELYDSLVARHGKPVALVDIDLSAGYQEWATLKFICNGVEKFSRKVHLREPMGKLRTLISQTLGLPKHSFVMYHNLCAPSHPEWERDLIELRCESLPMSRFDFAEGDEIHIDVQA